MIFYIRLLMLLAWLRQNLKLTIVATLLVIPLLVIAGHWGITRASCWRALRMGETHWGGTAFGAGLGDCVAKEWWRP